MKAKAKEREKENRTLHGQDDDDWTSIGQQQKKCQEKEVENKRGEIRRTGSVSVLLRRGQQRSAAFIKF